MSKTHEMGTDEYLKYLQSETPGELETSYNESVEEFIKEVKNANDDQKKKHFSMTFDNPLKGFPYNEQYGFDKNLSEVELEEAARIPMYKKTKFERKEFDRNKEKGMILKMAKAIHKVAAMQDKMQYTAETGGGRGGNPNKVWENLRDAEYNLYSYLSGIERGEYDGVIDMDRD